MGLFDIFKKKKTTTNFSPVDPNAGYGEYPNDWPMELKLAQASQHFQIMRDSVELINKTVYPKTYFYRYETAVREAEVVIKLCKRHELGKMAAETLAFLLSSRVEVTNNFLDRCDAANKLPFIKNELIAMHDKMPAECFEYFEELLGCHTDEDDLDEYIFCSVVFNEGGKSYYYLSDDEDIRCGDYVTVPVGKRNEENTGRVIKIEIFRGNNAPIPVDSLKYIIEIQD